MGGGGAVDGGLGAVDRVERRGGRGELRVERRHAAGNDALGGQPALLGILRQRLRAHDRLRAVVHQPGGGHAQVGHRDRRAGRRRRRQGAGRGGRVGGGRRQRVGPAGGGGGRDLRHGRRRGVHAGAGLGVRLGAGGGAADHRRPAGRRALPAHGQLEAGRPGGQRAGRQRRRYGGRRLRARVLRGAAGRRAVRGAWQPRAQGGGGALLHGGGGGRRGMGGAGVRVAGPDLGGGLLGRRGLVGVRRAGGREGGHQRGHAGGAGRLALRLLPLGRAEHELDRDVERRRPRLRRGAARLHAAGQRDLRGGGQQVLRGGDAVQLLAAGGEGVGFGTGRDRRGLRQRLDRRGRRGHPFQQRRGCPGGHHLRDGGVAGQRQHRRGLLQVGDGQRRQRGRTGAAAAGLEHAAGAGAVVELVGGGGGRRGRGPVGRALPGDDRRRRRVLREGDGAGGVRGAALRDVRAGQAEPGRRADVGGGAGGLPGEPQRRGGGGVAAAWLRAERPVAGAQRGSGGGDVGMGRRQRGGGVGGLGGGRAERDLDQLCLRLPGGQRRQVVRRVLLVGDPRGGGDRHGCDHWRVQPGAVGAIPARPCGDRPGGAAGHGGGGGAGGGGDDGHAGGLIHGELQRGPGRRGGEHGQPVGVLVRGARLPPGHHGADVGGGGGLRGGAGRAPGELRVGGGMGGGGAVDGGLGAVDRVERRGGRGELRVERRHAAGNDALGGQPALLGILRQRLRAHDRLRAVVHQPGGGHAQVGHRDRRAGRRRRRQGAGRGGRVGGGRRQRVGPAGGGGGRDLRHGRRRGVHAGAGLGVRLGAGGGAADHRRPAGRRALPAHGQLEAGRPGGQRAGRQRRRYGGRRLRARVLRGAAGRRAVRGAWQPRAQGGGGALLHGGGGGRRGMGGAGVRVAGPDLGGGLLGRRGLVGVRRAGGREGGHQRGHAGGAGRLALRLLPLGRAEHELDRDVERRRPRLRRGAARLHAAGQRDLRGGGQQVLRGGDAVQLLAAGGEGVGFGTGRDRRGLRQRLDRRGRRGHPFQQRRGCPGGHHLRDGGVAGQRQHRRGLLQVGDGQRRQRGRTGAAAAGLEHAAGAGAVVELVGGGGGRRGRGPVGRALPGDDRRRRRVLREGDGAGGVRGAALRDVRAGQAEPGRRADVGGGAGGLPGEPQRRGGGGVAAAWLRAERPVAGAQRGSGGGDVGMGRRQRGGGVGGLGGGRAERDLDQLCLRLPGGQRRQVVRRVLLVGDPRGGGDRHGGDHWRVQPGAVGAIPARRRRRRRGSTAGDRHDRPARGGRDGHQAGQ